MSSFSSMLDQIINSIGAEPWVFIGILVIILLALTFVIRKALSQKKKTVSALGESKAESLALKAPQLTEEVPKQQLRKREPEVLVKAEEALKEPEVLIKAEEALKEPEVLIKAEEAFKAPEVSIKVEEALKEPKVLIKAEVAPIKGIDAALKNTRGGFMAKLSSLFSRGAALSEEDFEELEAILFTADIGIKTAQKLLEALRLRVKKENLSDKKAIKNVLKEEMRAIFDRVPQKEAPLSMHPTVYMFVGVNGAGKTTSIGKLGAQMAAAGKKVFFGAGDTFRAAAVTQLSIWGERSHIPVIKGKENADSASVLFEAITQAKAKEADVVMCDTAGRLHTKIGLMDELKKVHRVMGKAHTSAPHEVFLVIDATMGQNAIAQAREFAEATPLTGVILSKLDGTAKGGVALGIVDELHVPIRFVGIGETSDDLRPFDAHEFVDALFAET